MNWSEKWLQTPRPPASEHQKISGILLLDSRMNDKRKRSVETTHEEN